MASNKSDQIWEKIEKGVFIIAEVGKNFIQTANERTVGEYLQNAKQLVDEAVAAGADAVKFQTHTVEDEQLNLAVESPHFKGGDRYRWVTRNTNATPLKEFLEPLKAHCEEKGVVFFSTPMSRGAAQKLDKVGVDLWKIGSGDILDFVLLDYLRHSGKPIIISSGMSTLKEIEQAITFLREKNDRVALLHCVSKYPCPPEDLHLRTIEFFKEKFSIPIGFSDHSIANDAALAAVALGATVLEKHFSLARELYGADHQVSQTPAEFAELVRNVRVIQTDAMMRERVLASETVQKGMGEKIKVLQEDEAVFRPLFRKSLMAGQDIPAGTALQPEMIYAMRPQQFAGGLPSEQYPNILGAKTTISLKKYDPITREALEHKA
ncbi:MAG: N-acetylneuraminate synthase family protein [Patescibacteria group bacterium]|nr:N-acetylneuraminate synthase family protein [Patescibacteria group bacterium]